MLAGMVFFSLLVSGEVQVKCALILRVDHFSRL